MTSLYPGMLFYSSGLNKKSTPYGPEVTPSEIEQKLGRVPFNGRPWPKSSPVSTVYDVRNSSTRMIILNNRMSKKPKGSRLRGQTDYQGVILHPEPFRHVTDETNTKWEHHKGCTSSVTEKFVPVLPRGVSPLPAWVNKTQRPPMKFDNGSGVNPNHHIQCQGHLDYDIVRWYNTHRRPRAQSRTSSVRESRAMSPILNDPSLSKGERRYLNHIAKIYSVDNMRAQKQHQYNQLMSQEISKGISKEADWQKYQRYLNTPRKTQFGPCDPKRSASASVAGRRSKKEPDDTRPHTTQTGARSARGSRGLSTAGSFGSKSQDERSKQKGQGIKGRDTSKQKDNIKGKPARVESPMPLMPRSDSSSSLSTLSSDQENKKETKGDKGKKEEEELSPPQERGKNENVDKEDVKESKNVKVTENTVVKMENKKKEDENRCSDDDKRKEEDEDERSKMSARDSSHLDADQPGRGVEYVPVYGERQGEEEKSRKQSDEENKSEHFRPRSPEAQKKVHIEEPVNENPVVLLPPAKEKESSSSDTDKSQDDNGPELIHHLHKEGGDRPLSRLGGRGQFTLVKKGNADNSDDDYSDDDEKEAPQRSGLEFEETTDQPRGDDSNNMKVMTQSSNGDNDVLLSLHKEGVDNVDDTAVFTAKDSPTGASSQEKHSTITTVEY